MEPICHEFGEASGREGGKIWRLGAWTADFLEGSMDESTQGGIFAIAALTSALGLTISEQTWGCAVSLVFLAVAGEIC